MFVQYTTYNAFNATGGPEGSADIDYWGQTVEEAFIYEWPADAFPSDCVWIVPGTEDL